MKTRMQDVRPLEFTEDDCTMTVQYDNRGEPYRNGVEFSFDREGPGPVVWVLLDRAEVAQLRDRLNEFLATED